MDPFAELAALLTPSVAKSPPEGLVLQAGNGLPLRVAGCGLPLEAGDLAVNPALDWRWTEDDGAPEKLRAGDRVVLLTGDGERYYILCKVVEA